MTIAIQFAMAVLLVHACANLANVVYAAGHQQVMNAFHERDEALEMMPLVKAVLDSRDGAMYSAEAIEVLRKAYERWAAL